MMGSISAFCSALCEGSVGRGPGEVGDMRLIQEDERGGKATFGLPEMDL